LSTKWKGFKNIIYKKKIAYFIKIGLSRSGINPCEGQKRCFKRKASGGVWESYFMIGLLIYEMSRPSNKKES